MFRGILDKRIDVRGYYFNTTVHRRYSIALASRARTNAPFSAKFLICLPCSATDMFTGDVAAENEYLVIGQGFYAVRRYSDSVFI